MTHIHEHCGKRLKTPQPRQTVLASATLTQSVLKRAVKWCPQPKYVSYDPPKTSNQGQDAEASSGSSSSSDGVSAGAASLPAWGWGAKGWDGPASEFAPKTEASIGAQPAVLKCLCKGLHG